MSSGEFGTSWPGRYRAAACVAFDLDAEAAVLAVDPAHVRSLQLEPRGS